MTGSDKLPDPSPFATESTPWRRRLVPIVVAFAFLMEQLDSTVITTAIPRMAEDLDTTVLRMSLAVTAYVLTLAVFIPVSGWFADRFGSRRVFTAAVLVFTLSSALCGLVENLPQLIAMRTLQGLGGAMMTPVGRLILLRSFPRSQLLNAMVYVSLPALIGPVIGPLVGGLLTSYVSWRWIFFINIPFGLVGVILALWVVKDFRVERHAQFDFSGFVLAGAGLALLQLGIENSGRPILPQVATVISLVLAVLLLVAFFRHARRSPAPAIDLSLFRLRSFRVGTLAGGISRIGINGVAFLLPLMLQVGFGLSPVESGGLTFFTAFGTLMIRLISSRALKKLGFDRVLPISTVVTAAAVGGFALLNVGTPHWLIAGYVVLFGLARSTQFMTSNTLSYADMPGEKLSGATSLAGVMQQLSVSFGVSAAALILGLVSDQSGILSVGDFHEAFLVMAIIPLLALPGFLQLRPEDGVAVSGHTRSSRKPTNKTMKENEMHAHLRQDRALARSTVEDIADRLFEARKTGAKIAVPQAELRLSDAYAVQDVLARRAGGIGAWKTSLPRSDFAGLGIYAMAVTAPILSDNRYRAEPGKPLTVREPVIDSDETVGLELEVAYQLGRDFPASREAPSEGEILGGIASAHLVVEICGARWSDPTPPFLWSLADSLMNRSFVVGQAIADWPSIDFTALAARQLMDGRLLQESTGGHKGGNPLSLVVWQVQHCVTQRGGIPSGTIITTGQLCGNHWVKPAGLVRGELPSLGASIEFSLTS